MTLQKALILNILLRAHMIFMFVHCFVFSSFQRPVHSELKLSAAKFNCFFFFFGALECGRWSSRHEEVLHLSSNFDSLIDQI